MKFILIVLGARPQFIKASVVSAAIAASNQLKEITIHTGQHFDAKMSEVYLGRRPTCTARSFGPRIRTRPSP